MKLSVLKAIFGSMRQGVVFIDDQNRIAYCNRAAEEIRNIQQDKVLGQSILECHPPQSHPKVLKIIEEEKTKTLGNAKGLGIGLYLYRKLLTFIGARSISKAN